jgi:CcmD family protein
MSYVLAGYGITALALAGYALSLARRLRGTRQR